MLLLDQAATVLWVGQMYNQPLGSKLVPHSGKRDFQSVKDALQFIMETMNKSSRPSAMIQTDGATLYAADIEAMYLQT